MKQNIVLLLLPAFFFLSCKKEMDTQVPARRFSLSLDSLSILQANIPNDIYNDMTFVNPTTGYAVSRNGRIIKSIDGGYKWNELSSGVNFYLNKIQFLNAATGFVIGGDSTDGFLLKTQNAGGAWQQVHLNMPQPGWPTGMFFLNTTTGFVTGKSYFKKTVDGGATWKDAVSTIKEDITDVSFKNSNEGYATSLNGRYLKTTDGGNSWQLIQSDISDPLGSICHSLSHSFAIGGTNLVDLQTGKALSAKLPVGIRKILFLNDVNAVGIGQHYEAGFWPYGDIFLTNDSWNLKLQKTYSPASEALDITAIAKKSDGSVLMIGAALLATPLFKLTY